MRRGSCVTAQQARIHELFVRHGSMSVVAREVGVSAIRVREALVQYERNRLRDQGVVPPTLREMMLGDVATRFGTLRTGIGGRPAKHARAAAGGAPRGPSAAPRGRVLPATASCRRFVVTTVVAGAEVHNGFWGNLKAFADWRGAELLVIRRGAVGLVGGADARLRALAETERVDIGGLVDVAADVRVPSRSMRPLDSLALPRSAAWTIVPHAAIQLETLPRLRSEGLRIRMTTGAATIPATRSRADQADGLGAVVVEVRDGVAHCRHVLATAEGDGAFHDLDVYVAAGVVAADHRVAAIVFGDVHHAHLDPGVAMATWGIRSDGRVVGRSLVDRLRPATMIFHDVCDFSARSHHDARDPHRRFALMTQGRDDVRDELRATADFLALTRRDGCASVVVPSNHDAALARWLREADFRLDPANAEFFLECSLALYRHMALGHGTDGVFERTLRALSPDGLADVRFLATGEGLEVAGVECGIHGHAAADGKRGSMQFFEGLGIRAVLGHSHRPTTRGGICSAGVCQPDLAYARGPVTAWAIGHVAVHHDGARQHLIYDGGRFHA
ncbi:MAG: hypothetical protein B7Y49_02075 [Sphingomonas sp. 28-62-11]|nr:MAG: hypothetical protein B7Y49_02075 [Sphingomonas sp. 28-62-11]